ncbi:RNA-directed DNA polymerase, eukaryota [Tanacetum coccineum]
MESMRSHFFSGAELSSKKAVWVKWKHVLASKDKCGLARVIKALNGNDGKIGQKVKSGYPSIWLDIIHEVDTFKSRGIDLVSLIHAKLGLDVSFHWPPRGGVEQHQLGLLKEKVVGKMIDDFMLPEVSSKTRLIKVVPIKVNVHAWKVKIDGLPTRLNISRRGIDIKSILCPMCGKAVESTSHIFFTCQMSKEILRKISRWWDIDYMEVSSYEEWLDWIVNTRLPVKSKQVFEGGSGLSLSSLVCQSTIVVSRRLSGDDVSNDSGNGRRVGSNGKLTVLVPPPLP